MIFFKPWWLLRVVQKNYHLYPLCPLLLHLRVLSQRLSAGLHFGCQSKVAIILGFHGILWVFFFRGHSQEWVQWVFPGVEEHQTRTKIVSFFSTFSIISLPGAIIHSPTISSSFGEQIYWGFILIINYFKNSGFIAILMSKFGFGSSGAISWSAWRIISLTTR